MYILIIHVTVFINTNRKAQHDILSRDQQASNLHVKSLDKEWVQMSQT